MPTLAQAQAATLDKFIEGWKKWTFEDWSVTWSSDITQQMLPLSLGIHSKSLDEIKQILPTLMKTLTNYELNIHEVVHDVSRGKAVIYATSKADMPFGDLKWTNEYTMFLTFTENGEKIKRMEEMLDTAFYFEFFPRFQQYLSEQRALK